MIYFPGRKSDGTFYSFYYDVQKLSKIAGSPTQIESGQILAAIAEPVIFSGVDFVGAIIARNTGQSIWSQNNISIGSESGNFKLKNYSLNSIEPTKLGIILFKAAQGQQNGIYVNSLYLNGGKGQKITNSFSIEAGLVTLDKVQIQGFFAKIADLKSRYTFRAHSSAVEQFPLKEKVDGSNPSGLTYSTLPRCRWKEVAPLNFLSSVSSPFSMVPPRLPK